MRPCPICCYPIMSLTPSKCPGCGSLLRVGSAALEDRVIMSLRERLKDLPYPPEALSFVHRAMEMAVLRPQLQGIEGTPGTPGVPGVPGTPGARGATSAFRPVGPAEFAWSLCDYARRLFDREAGSILVEWGIHTSDDIGAIVEILWEEGLVEGDLMAMRDQFRGLFEVPDVFEDERLPREDR